MTPKEKAEELFNEYWTLIAYKIEGSVGRLVIKQCALIAIDQIIDATTKRWGGVNPETGFVINNVKVNPYWVEVKQEIEKL
jgi:hypothetical protein